MDIGKMRIEFVKGKLDKNDLNVDPFLQFEKWFQQAVDGDLTEPNAFILSTVNKGVPSSRTVLLKLYDKDGFVFFTNYESKKGLDIEKNNNVSVLFPWLDLQRQVKIIGKAEKISAAQSLKYFLSRPRGSQIGAWASNQSQVVSSRQLLLTKFEQIKSKFEKKEIPLPDNWGGYRIVPTKFEFWQGRKNRLHDRFEYTQTGNKWKIQRLAP